MASSDESITRTNDGPPQTNRHVRRSTSMLSIDSDLSQQSNLTGGSLNLSVLHSSSSEGSGRENSKSETHEDEKARMMMHFMKNHAEAVTVSLVERTMLIQSVVWLSHHVPGCVLKLLIETILRHRTSSTDIGDGNIQAEPIGDSDISSAMRRITAADAYDSPSLSMNNCEILVPLNDVNKAKTHTLPISITHDSALLFVDMSGFSKISTILDIESLSNAINSYFQLIVNEVTTHGGDILKFAGDAIFAEWSGQNIDYCVIQASECAASIVANCSDYPIYSKPVGLSRATIRLHNTRQSSDQSSNRNLRRSIQSADGYSKRESVISDTSNEDQNHYLRRISMTNTPKPVKLATLNVKCGVGVGRIVGIHVGDDAHKREYLILGDPIDQVTAAEKAATSGEVFASPEAMEVLSRVSTIQQNSEETTKEKKPVCIAERKKKYFELSKQYAREEIAMSNDPENILHRCEDLNDSELRWLKSLISLYVHPVVVNDENESITQVSLKQESDLDRHLSQAELRNVFVMFISPMVDCRLKGDEGKDQELIFLLNSIMNLTTKQVKKAGGHLRQFIVDDKGVILIATFGLRGSTFPNMISKRALPLSRSIHNDLQEELGVKSKIGGTFGRAYCGVVGGLVRHEFAVLGPSVNLAARLCVSNFNPGILVDKVVRLLSSDSQIFFKPLPPVKAKGYDEPVPIFEPIRSNESQWGKSNHTFVGRSNEIKQIMQVAKCIALNNDASKFIFVSAESGSGKSAMITQTTARVRAMTQKMKKRIIVTRHISNEGDSRVPFSLFRSIFKSLLAEMRHINEDCHSHSCSRGNETFEISVEWDDLSLDSVSTKDSVMSTDANRFRYICEELNAPPEFVEVVGRRLLGIRDNTLIKTFTGGSPNLDIIVDFLADAFIRCTKHTDVALLALDDVHEMDEMSWRVVRAIFEKGLNVLVLCGSRPPSINTTLAVDPIFWDNLKDSFSKEGRFIEIDLQPLEQDEVRDLIAVSLDVDSEQLDSSFTRNLATATGGMPHFLSYVVDAIKRQELLTKLESGMIGMKNATNDKDKIGFESVSELLLYRLDALDSSVRNALHIAAVLGSEFELVDASLAYDEMYSISDYDRMRAALALQEAFHVAVKEGILEESFASSGNDHEEVVDDPLDARTSLCASLGNITLSLKGYRKTHPAYSENRRYRFTHSSWKSSIIDIMLDERVQEIHEHIAIILEREIDLEDAGENDFDKQVRVFHHWNASGHFMNASSLALKIGGEMMLLGLNTQSILLFDDVLNTLTDFSADQWEETHGGIATSMLNAIEASELENLIKIKIAKGKAYSTLGNGERGAEALQSALDILQYAPCANNPRFDRSVSFPIFSGLFVVLKMGAIVDDEQCTYEKHLTSKFVEQARLNNDPVHYGRALAMEGETLGRLGLFEEAIERLDMIRTIYDIDTQHAAICKSYGSDRVAQAFAHSVNWNTVLGRSDEVSKTCKYILETLAPKSDSKNVHNSFCLLYSTIIAMKENGSANEARNVLTSLVVEPFDENFGPGGSTYSKPLFYPLQMLLDLQGHQHEPIDHVDYLQWVLSESIFSVCSPSYDKAWSAIAVSPNTWLGEICYYLAKRPECSTHRDQLIKTGLCLMEKAIESTDKLPFANQYAKKKMLVLKRFNEELNETYNVA